MAKPAAPEHLPPAAEFSRHAAPAAVARAATPNLVVPVLVRGVDPAWRTPDMGVALFAAETGADFVWQPLAGAAPAADGSLLVECTTGAMGDVVVTLASERRFARHGYLAKLQTRPVVASRDRSQPMELAVRAAAVTFAAPELPYHVGPLRLARRDDPDWLPPLPTATGLAFDGATRHTLLLGAGDYELRDPLSDRAQQFSTPATTNVAINGIWAAARADRP